MVLADMVLLGGKVMLQLVSTLPVVVDTLEAVGIRVSK